LDLDEIVEMVKPVRINPLARKILIWWNRLFFKPPALSFGEKMNRAENVLICFPSKIESFASAKEHLTAFADLFQNKKIFVFLPLIEGKTFLSHLKRICGDLSSKRGSQDSFSPSKEIHPKDKGLRF